MPLPDILGRLGLRLDPGRPALSVAFVGSDATAVNMPPRPYYRALMDLGFSY